jgi:hypothetical protein
MCRFKPIYHAQIRRLISRDHMIQVMNCFGCKMFLYRRKRTRQGSVDFLPQEQINLCEEVSFVEVR